MKRALYSVLLVALATAVAAAKQHPVPLDKNIDGAKCLECHEEKSKGKSVHTAIATGCLSCHEVRVNKDITRVKLKTATPAKLCATCHADKSAAEIKGRVHSPAVRDCLECHDAHTAPNKNQLLKPTAGATKDDNLCLACHTTGLNVPEKGSRHAALDMGCETCHVTHKTGDKPDREFRYHLTKNAPALCMDCHDPKDAALIEAHQKQPFAKTDCLTCHDPHQSTRPKLMQAFVHSPFEGGKSSCESCHQPAKEGKVVLTTATAKELCLTCHADKTEQIEKAKVQHPGAAGDCTDCHNPHAGKYQGFPKPDAVNVCLNCHSDQAAQAKKAHLHQPVFEQGCAICHQPHGGDNYKMLRANNPNSLCLECHGPEVQPKKLAAEHMVTVFDGKVRLPEDYFRKVTVLPVRYGRGHPTARHPIKDQPDPNDSSKTIPLNCASCHQPHASAQSNLLVRDQSSNMDFCASCHASLGK